MKIELSSVTEDCICKLFNNTRDDHKISDQFDMLCILHDGILVKNSQEDIQELITNYETNFFSNNKTKKKETVTEKIDINLLLNIDESTGIKCVECGNRETTYKLQATRSADEGMSACCVCRVCNHRWIIKN